MRCYVHISEICQTLVMFQSAFKNLDKKKWFDKMQPQTLMIATWLLYIDGAYALLGQLDNNRWSYSVQGDSVGNLLSFAALIAYVGGPFLMANGKKLGWYVALAASFSPFILRAYLRIQYSFFNIPLIWVFKGQSLVNFAFEAALCALLLHQMSRSYVNRWLR